MQSLFLSYGAGLLTTLNPCVLPMLPFVIAAALREGKFGPVALVAGMSATFTIAGVAVAALGPAIGLTLDQLRIAGAAVLVVLGAAMILPVGQRAFAYAFAPAADGASTMLDKAAPSGLQGQFLTGALMGVVWTPCAGPTLFAAISLASQSGTLPLAAGMMMLFSLGAGTVLLLLAYGAREVLARRKDTMMAFANSAKGLIGYLFLALGLLILTGLDKKIEAALVSAMPDWLVEITTRI